ncbi:quinone-dependent dihydroorotate dehydrogenase [Aureibacter tunicatorum]|uniref:Dihydroorotate dehydrogenase (quinone) n=1 Tax=Aureibacter tunicatorum TaxID=866807 RepID=A0AAE4BTV5_9BACT|nr:quinone-dependent dihydroorotate dehydrogenase [Aureibacter tunicatorum]MDR6240178.1 dihydroorotate dehydrogenase [Aureibacter tunicatorum]BDD05941.1 dihydroorotate dehydrogenase (quinone) [Aureibacter tunicatorum]
MYNQLVKPILFRMTAEKAHHFTVKLLKFANAVPGVSSVMRSIYKVEDKRLEREVFGIKFKNPVGLAAGFDKDAAMIDELSNVGFGFIEIGTVTPVGQPGNPQPRLFRLVDDRAVINRMGFNNEGVKASVERLKKRKSDVIVGGNIGKNKATANEDAVKDYEICFEELYPYVDYFVVNVSSPNTPNLRALQEKEPLTQLLSHLKNLRDAKEKRKPILLKIAPDLTDSQLDDIVDILQTVKIDGLIATNTTISRDGLKTPSQEVEEIGMGGLSGKPLRERATEVIRYIHKKSNGAFPIIGVGGIDSPEDAIEKLNAGASLVQVYTGFIFNGPGFVKSINKRLLEEN